MGESMTRDDHRDGFVMHLIDAQSRLYAYILSIVLDRERARDIAQQTNLVLLEKQGDFQPGTSFFAWASKVAFYEILADRRSRQRERHLFSDELLALVANEAEQAAGSLEERKAALEECIQTLAPGHRDAINARYRPGGSVAALAASLNKSAGAVSAMLHRIRVALAECVERKLQKATS
ncbi:MAG: sigma-70 family RNA polymerase sigma factor [Planctomycetota bacterium]